MPTKKTTAKKTASITAKFSAKVPEEVIRECGHRRIYKKSGWSAGALYFFWLVGAAIYFIGTATTFRIGVLGVLKAFVRPVFLVHGLLKYLGL